MSFLSWLTQGPSKPKTGPRASVIQDKSWVPEDYYIYVLDTDERYVAVCAMKHSRSDKYRKLEFPWGFHKVPYYSHNLRNPETGYSTDRTDEITEQMVQEAFDRVKEEVINNQERHTQQLLDIHKAYLELSKPSVLQSKKKFLGHY